MLRLLPVVVQALERDGCQAGCRLRGWTIHEGSIVDV